MRIWPVLAIAALAAALLQPAFGGAQEDALRELAENRFRALASHRAVVDAVRMQNVRHRSLSLDEIMALDRQWRGEILSDSKPMIRALMANPLSFFVGEERRKSAGLITEIIVMDDKGLNVGLSDITTDYWQGDEDKWQKTFLAGPRAIFIDTVKRDQSTGHLQSQVSLPVVDPETHKPIGAITFGIDVSRLSYR